MAKIVVRCLVAVRRRDRLASGSKGYSEAHLARYHISFVQALAGAMVLALAGCGMPTSGPRGETIEWRAATRVRTAERLPYCLVSVTPRVAEIVARTQYRLAGQFSDRRGPTSVQIGNGDVISVTLFEAAAGGLFFPLEGGLRNGNFLTLPPQIVDDKGTITVPYAGAIRAKGRTAQEIQAAIVEALKGRALEPQAVVTVVERRNAMISVLGEVNSSIRFPANVAGERVLDAIARAGGIKSAGQDSWVLLERHRKIAVAPFEALIHEAGNNIYVQPQDTVYVYKEPQTFLAFGAAGKQGQVPFDAWRLTLAEALAKAGGLLDERAEPGWVFLYRGERQQVVQDLGSDCSVNDGPFVPVIYEIDLRDPSSLFLATHFPMRNKDVIYISNARSVESSKFMQHVRLMNATIQDPINTAIAGYVLKNLINGTGTSSSVIIAGSPTP
jgi:polysaccharide biosynthesis/export protein